MLNHDKDIPLYQQLADRLLAAILQGEYQDGNRLPSENRLCREYGVSRITVRQALAQLEKRDMVYTVQGKGTFVRIPVIKQQLFKIVNFGKTLEEKGLSGHSKVLSFQSAVRNPEMERLLAADEQGPICRLELLGYAQGTPIVYYDSYMRQDVGQKMHFIARIKEQEGKAFSTFDLYRDAEIAVSKIDQMIRAVNADRKMAELMNIPKGMALVALESMVLDENQQPVEHKMGYYRSDKYAFSVRREI